MLRVWLPLPAVCLLLGWPAPGAAQAALSPETGRRGERTELGERRVEVEESDDSVGAAIGHARPGDEDRKSVV